MSNLIKFLHVKCRNSTYPKTDLSRFPVPDVKVSWEILWEDYNPPQYNSPVLIGKPWADPDDPTIIDFNNFNDQVNRKSHEGEYKIEKGFPLNSYGRTGLKGRGLLGRWGPNHAADPLVTRWHPLEGRPHLQFIAIKRGDCGEWALPGGMVDPGEKISMTLKREFEEEALANGVTFDLDGFFKEGIELYRGYVDDPRNTDHAWMETVCVNFHDAEGVLKGVLLKAGSDAVGVQWKDVKRDMKLYASHWEFLRKAVEYHQAVW